MRTVVKANGLVQPLTTTSRNDQEKRCFEPWAYVGLLGVAEVISDVYLPVLGGWIHLVLWAWLLFRGSLLYNTAVGKYYSLFSLLPLIRLISMATPSTVFPKIWYDSLTEGLVLIFVVVVSVKIGLRSRDMGLSMPHHLWLLPFALLTGIGSGWIEYQIIHSSPLSASMNWTQVWLTILLLYLFTGVTEEIIFRGVLFTLALRFYSPLMTILISTAGWTVLHIGWHSWKDLFLVFCTGLLWGWIRYYTRSVVLITVAHGLANIMLFIIMPNL